MNDPTNPSPDAPDAPAESPEAGPRYRVEVLAGARPTAEGVDCGDDASIRLIHWSRVRRAMAAEVGEPQGVRTIVFDLVVDEAEECVLYRFDADPGQDAVEVARVIAGALAPDRAEGSIKSLATDGVASRWYPDLESFEAANLAILS